MCELVVLRVVCTCVSSLQPELQLEDRSSLCRVWHRISPKETGYPLVRYFEIEEERNTSSFSF